MLNSPIITTQELVILGKTKKKGGIFKRRLISAKKIDFLNERGIFYNLNAFN